MLPFSINNENANIIKVIGVGGGGSNAVNHMYRQGVKGVDFIICNTDSQALDISPVPYKIQLGSTLTEGRGAGSMPEVGKNAAIENIQEIKEILKNNTKMVFITAGMGGGTGTGGAPIIASVAKELGILTVGIVTLPFTFEGKKRKIQADYGIEELKGNVDTLIIISNDKLREIYGNLKLTQAFGHADDVVTTAAKGISDIITTTLHINTDFADIETVLRESGVAIMGSGSASGENRAIEAIEAALNSPLLNDNDITGARYVLLNITCGDPEITMDELTDITDYIQNAAGQSADIIHGYGIDPSLGDEVKVTVIATGFKNKPDNNLQFSKPEKIVKSLIEDRPSREITIETLKQNAFEPISVSNHTNTIEPQLQENVNLVEASVKPEELPNKMVYELGENSFEVSEPEAIVSVTNNVVENQLDIKIVSSENNFEKSEEENSITDERIKRLKQFNYRGKINSANMQELENTPAYIRKNIELNEVPHSSESNISKFSLGEGEDGKGGLRQDNSFLFDNVD